MSRWLTQLMVASFLNPRQAAREVLRVPLANSDLFILVVLVAILLTLAVWVLAHFGQANPDPLQEFVKSQPLMFAVIQVVSIPVGAAISLVIARLFGGKGSFRDTIVIILWLNAAMALLQTALLVLMPIVAPMAVLFLLATLVWFIVAYAAGVAEIHGFKNIYLVMAAIVGLFLLFFVVVNVLAVVAGYVPAGRA